MAKVCTYLKNDGHKVRVGYVSLAGLEALDNRGVNSMSEAVPGKRVWLIVYDENRPCKSYTNGPRGHFLFYKGEKTMTKREKALWLHEHYKNYSLKWYLENDARLNAMFRKVYHRYMTDLNARASKAQLSHIEDLGKRMREVYEDVYGTNFDSDCRLDRAETNRKVQAIRSMWVVAPA